MPEKNPVAAQPVTADATTPGAGAPPVVRRHPGHRGADVRDTVAEMAAKAQEISMEAGSKMAAAMKDVINAAAGLTSFAIESSRDLVQYMVRRGQMTQEEADKLIREAEDSWSKKHRGKKPPSRGPASESASKGPTKPASAAVAARKPVVAHVAQVAHRSPPAKKVAKKPTRKAPAKHAKPKKKVPTHKKPAAKK